jgi:hypothetical protein
VAVTTETSQEKASFQDKFYGKKEVMTPRFSEYQTSYAVTTRKSDGISLKEVKPPEEITPSKLRAIQNTNSLNKAAAILATINLENSLALSLPAEKPSENIEEPRSRRRFSSHGDFRRYLYEAVVLSMREHKSATRKCRNGLFCCFKLVSRVFHSQLQHKKTHEFLLVPNSITH